MRHESGALSRSVKQQSTSVRLELESVETGPEGVTLTSRNHLEGTQTHTCDSSGLTGFVVSGVLKRKRKKEMGQMTPRVDLLLHAAKYGSHPAAVAGSCVGHDLPFVPCEQDGESRLD